MLLIVTTIIIVSF